VTHPALLWEGVHLATQSLDEDYDYAPDQPKTFTPRCALAISVEIRR
jgi:hypothetical protein